MKKILVSITSTLLFFSFVPAVFAHVIVYPHQVGIGATQVFDMSVPTEKNNPTIAIRLLIPKGLQEVVPSVKNGWTITVKKHGDTVTELDWTNGSIPPNERDDFYFSAQVPATPQTLHWNAYQTYQDGSIVAWSHTPTTNPEDDSAPPPYSITQVTNDLSTPKQQDTLPIDLSILALLLSLIAVGISFKKRA